MSRIGKKPVSIPENVKVETKGATLKVSGPKGSLEMSVHPGMEVNIEGDTIHVARKGDNRNDRAIHGLVRSLIANMMVGVSSGYEKVLEVDGLGFRAKVEGKDLSLQLGFSHPITFAPPEGVSFEVESLPRNPERPSLQCLIHIRGADKHIVGDIAAKIRSLRKPEPYKGTGIRYKGEVVRKKAGKTGV
jgi:large subunit ribosomal protein L6